MSYSSNPLLPKARIWAVNLVRQEQLPLLVAARRAGIHRTTLWRWLQRYDQLGMDKRNKYLPTRSSRPHTNGRAVAPAVVERIRYYRLRYRRCAVVVHAHCVREGTVVSLSTVRRVLRRLGLVARRKWQRGYRPPVPRPAADAPSALVQTDTVHLYDHATKGRTYLYTLVDVYSRWSYSEHSPVLSQTLAAQ